MGESEKAPSKPLTMAEILGIWTFTNAMLLCYVHFDNLFLSLRADGEPAVARHQNVLSACPGHTTSKTI